MGWNWIVFMKIDKTVIKEIRDVISNEEEIVDKEVNKKLSK